MDRIAVILETNAAELAKLRPADGPPPHQTRVDWIAWALEQQRDELQAVRAELAQVRAVIRDTPRELLEFAVAVVLAADATKSP